MRKVDAVNEALELFVAPFDDEPGAWSDVLRRASIGSDVSPRSDARRRRRLAAAAFAAAVLLALAVSPVGGALVRGFGDFSAWLTGSPGEPASESAQRAFEEGNARSWLRFPDGPTLRSLIRTEAAGGTFELFGFRSGNKLCLRLTVEGIPADVPPALGCAPLDELRRAQAPAVTVIVDSSFGSRQDVTPNEEGYVPARASASFGVVADGVEAVELETNEGRVEAIVASNAFLAVTENPPLGMRTKELTAVGAQGQRVTVPLAEAPFGDYGAPARPGAAPGPTKVERQVEGGTIGWLLRREPRGQSLEEAGLDASQFGLERIARGEVIHARVITPDPQGHAPFVIGVVRFERGQLPFGQSGEQVCTLVAYGGGCSPIAHLFPPGLPFSVGTMSGYGGNEYVLVEGLASDDVARLELFLANGERTSVPLKDNAYLVEVARLKFPARLVAYDAEGRVIGIESDVHDPLSDRGPRPIPDKQRVVVRVVGANGTKGVVRVGPSTAGTRCHRISFENGAGGGGCLPKGMEPQLSLGVLNTGSDSFVTGTVADGTATIELRFPSGERVVVEVVEGVVAHPLTPAQAADGGPKLAVALDREGGEVGRQPFRRAP